MYAHDAGAATVRVALASTQPLTLDHPLSRSDGVMQRHNEHNAHFAAFVFVLSTSVIGCVQEVGAPDLEISGSAQVQDKDAVIIGSVNWQESVSLPADSAERANASAVAYLSIPAEGTRCTGFLIAPNVIMTNQHCIPRASSANGVQAYFHWEQGATSDTPVSCSTFLGNDAALDFALLQCAGSPGDTYGVVELQGASLARNDPVYVIHQNCDYYTSPSCDPTKKYSPGKVTSTGSELGHDADTLGGSSGSPMFSRATHAVVGLHHVGLSNDGNGRGTENRAVRMSSILPVLAERYPGLQLGAQAPVDPGQAAPAAPATDGYEPNDAFAGAVQVQVPFGSQGARIDGGDGGDVDHFAFAGGATRTITLAFSHAAGDLDMYVYDAASGAEVARSIGTTDVETIARAFGDGMFTIRVHGYQGATGDYTLSVE